VTEDPFFSDEFDGGCTEARDVVAAGISTSLATKVSLLMGSAARTASGWGDTVAGISPSISANRRPFRGIMRNGSAAHAITSGCGEDG
jgi:hypothetical protein